MISTIIILLLGVFGLIGNIINHGKKRKKYNAYYYFIAMIVTWYLYYNAGIFNNLKILFQ